MQPTWTLGNSLAHLLGASDVDHGLILPCEDITMSDAVTRPNPAPRFGLLLSQFLLVVCSCGGEESSTVPNTPPTVSITSPTDGTEVFRLETVTLQGTGSDLQDGMLTGSSLVWSSQLDGELGTGTSITVSTLSIGAHTIRLEAKDSQGLIATATIAVTVEPREARVSVPLGTSVPGCETTGECFIPDSVAIDVGGQVIWSNDDAAAHTVTSGTTANGPDGTFDSGLFFAGTTFVQQFASAGTFDYFCQVHRWQVGKVVVE